MNTIKILPASYYQAIYRNNLEICGVEDRMPQLIGSDTDFCNFDKEINQ